MRTTSSASGSTDSTDCNAIIAACNLQYASVMLRSCAMVT